MALAHTFIQETNADRFDQKLTRWLQAAEARGVRIDHVSHSCSRPSGTYADLYSVVIIGEIPEEAEPPRRIHSELGPAA